MFILIIFEPFLKAYCLRPLWPFERMRMKTDRAKKIAMKTIWGGMFVKDITCFQWSTAGLKTASSHTVRIAWIPY